MPQPKTELRAQFKFLVTITGIRYSSRCLTGKKNARENICAIGN